MTEARSLNGFLVLAVALGGLGVVVALPMTFVFLQAIFPGMTEGVFSAPFSGYAKAFAQDGLPRLLMNTTLLGLTVGVGCLIVALPLAVLRGLSDLPGKAVWDVLFLIPFMLPPYIAAFAWVMTLQPGGFTTQLLGFNLRSWLFSFWGIVFVMTMGLFPVVYFALSRTLAVIGGRFADVGRVCGASPLMAFWRITLPLATPGLAASLLLVFALTIEEFGTPHILGKSAGFSVLVTSIHLKFVDWPIDLPGAAVLSTLLVGLAVCAFLVQHWLVTRRSFVAVSGKPGQRVAFRLGRWTPVAVALFGLVSLLAVVIPVAAVVLTALSRTLSGGLAWSNFGLRHFETVLTSRRGVDALMTSLSLAAVAALVAGALGLLTAFIAVRSRLPGRSLVDALSLLPNTLPGMVVAVGLILAWNHSWWPVTVYGTAGILVLAYVCLLLPYPVRYVGSSLRQLGPSLDAAARVSGASLAVMLWRILVPLVMPSLLVSMLLVFAIASRELVASIMVAPPGMTTVATFVYGQFEQGSPGVGMAMSVIGVFTTTAILIVLARTFREA